MGPFKAMNYRKFPEDLRPSHAGNLLAHVGGTLRPDLVSFLPSMRSCAGNWASATWCTRTSSGTS